MSRRSRLPDLLKWWAIRWLEKRMSQADAAKHLNVSRSVVRQLWNQSESKDSVSRRHVPGRLRITTPAGDHYLALSSQSR
ncbi:hypothetical protein X975_01732, partial [Stegodyphus mimosarum]